MAKKRIPERNENKFKAIFLANSKTMSLREMKNMYHLAYTVSDDEYSDISDQKDFLGTKARMEKIMRLSETRDLARQRMIMRFTPKPKLTGNRADAIARFATKFQGPRSYDRFGTMPGFSPRYKERKGSSAGKLGKTKYIGFKKFNRDFDALMRSLLNLTGPSKAMGKHIHGVMTKLRQRITITPKI